MPVHANSIISLSINTFDSALYDALTTKENFLYLSVYGEPIYKPYVQDLNDAILAWMNVARPASKIRDVIISMYSKISIDNLYGAGGLPSADSRNIFTINGFRSRIKTDPVDYYDDYDSFTMTVTRLINDKTLILNAYTSQEVSALDSLITSLRGSTAGSIYTQLFENLAITNPAKTKQQLANDIFITLNWKEVLVSLNVSGVTLPSYI